MTKHIVFIEASLSGAGEACIEYAISQSYKISLISADPAKFNLHFKKENIARISVVVADTDDRESLLSSLFLLQQISSIDGITTTHDIYVPITAFCASVFDLPGSSFASASCARNKYLMRLLLQKNIPDVNPPFVSVNSIDMALEAIRNHFDGYPLLLKPKLANDSFMVQLVRSDEEVISYFDEVVSNHSELLEEGVLLEGFIEGQEFSVDTVSDVDVTIHILGISKKEKFFGESFTKICTSFSYDKEMISRVERNIIDVLKSMGLGAGVFHTEFKLSPEGDFKVIEINARLAGDMIGSHCIKFATGVDAAGLVVDVALGKEINVTRTLNKAAAIYGVVASKSGVFENITNVDASVSEFVEGDFDLTIWAQAGEKVHQPISNRDLLGRIAVQGDSRNDAVERARNVAKTLNLKLQ